MAKQTECTKQVFARINRGKATPAPTTRSVAVKVSSYLDFASFKTTFEELDHDK